MNLKVKDADGSDQYVKATGAGSNADPVVTEHTISAQIGSFTDRSSTLTAAATSQTVMPANTARKFFLFQNNSGVPIWINFGIAAVQTQPSIQISPNGGSMVLEGSFVSTEIVTVIGSAAGQAYTAKEA